MNKHFNDMEFTDPTTIKYWDEIYTRDDFYGDIYKQRMNTVLSWVESSKLSEKSIVLDAGCGTGRFARDAANNGLNVVGLDYSHGMLQRAKGLGNGADAPIITFLQGNIEALPLKNSSFDQVVCLGVVAYLPSEEKSLDEMARVLKPDGVLAISIVNKARLVYRMDLPRLIFTIIKKMWNSLFSPWVRSADNHNSLPFTTYLIPQFRKSLERSGFTVIAYTTVPWKLPTFFGKEVLPRKFAAKITLFIGRFSNIPIIGSFGGMCIFKAKKVSMVIK